MKIHFFAQFLTVHHKINYRSNYANVDRYNKSLASLPYTFAGGDIGVYIEDEILKQYYPQDYSNYL